MARCVCPRWVYAVCLVVSVLRGCNNVIVENLPSNVNFAEGYFQACSGKECRGLNTTYVKLSPNTGPSFSTGRPQLVIFYEWKKHRWALGDNIGIQHVYAYALTDKALLDYEGPWMVISTDPSAYNPFHHIIRCPGVPIASRCSYVEGRLGVNTGWGLDKSPYCVKNKLIVPDKIRLIITQGVRVICLSTACIEVHSGGLFAAIGDDKSPVHISCNGVGCSSDAVWGGEIPSQMKYTYLDHAKGYVRNPPTALRASGHTKISNTRAHGVLLSGSGPSARNLWITGSELFGATIQFVTHVDTSLFQSSHIKAVTELQDCEIVKSTLFAHGLPLKLLGSNVFDSDIDECPASQSPSGDLFQIENTKIFGGSLAVTCTVEVQVTKSLLFHTATVKRVGNLQISDTVIVSGKGDSSWRMASRDDSTHHTQYKRVAFIGQGSGTTALVYARKPFNMQQSLVFNYSKVLRRNFSDERRCGSDGSTIYQSAFFRISDTIIDNECPCDLNASSNYWDTDQLTKIPERIWDAEDDPLRGKVYYTNPHLEITPSDKFPLAPPHSPWRRRLDGSGTVRAMWEATNPSKNVSYQVWTLENHRLNCTDIPHGDTSLDILPKDYADPDNVNIQVQAVFGERRSWFTSVPVLFWLLLVVYLSLFLLWC
ncbi:hypothetical protein AAMO2058_001319800 [Amorphochlora amoebiformis]